MSRILCRLPRWHSCKESSSQCRRCKRCGFDPWVRKISWKKAWQPTPVFLPGKSHGQRSLAGYSPWVPKELDTTERVHSCCKYFMQHVVLYCRSSSWQMREWISGWRLHSGKQHLEVCITEVEPQPKVYNFSFCKIYFIMWDLQFKQLYSKFWEWFC